MTASPGERVTVTFLEMTERPGPPPPAPAGLGLSILRAADPPVHWFLYLYRTVGGPYRWTDWLRRPEEDLAAFLAEPAVTLHTFVLEGWPAGFFLLDARVPGVCDLGYFGLVPEAVGRGMGRWALGQAVATGWAQPGVSRMTVNTCTLDHPRAMGLYRDAGFEPVRRVTHHLPG